MQNRSGFCKRATGAHCLTRKNFTNRTSAYVKEPAGVDIAANRMPMLPSAQTVSTIPGALTSRSIRFYPPKDLILFLRACCTASRMNRPA